MYDNYNNIPQEMQTYNQWIVWRYEHNRDEKPTKILYNVATGSRASVSDPSSWATFDSAVACARANIEYSGIGFVFTADDPFCGIDLDVKDGALPSDVQQFVFNKLDSYAEASPSGRGAHIIIKGGVPHGRNNQQLGIEIYSKGRYFTMTGNLLNELQIQNRGETVLELWHEIGGVFDDNKEDEQYKISNIVAIDDTTLIERICASGKNNAYFNWTAAFDWSEAYRSVLGAACLFSSDEQQIKRVILASPLVTNAPPHGGETRPRRVERLWAREYGYASRQGDMERGDAPYRIWSRQWFPGGSRELYKQIMEQSIINANNIISSNTARVLEAAKRARRAPHTDINTLPVPITVAGLVKTHDLDITQPPGIFNSIVAEVCARTRNPSSVMAVWAVLGFVSGAVGRAYVTAEGAGINNFLILSAGTNTGKTQHWSALESVIRETAPKLLDHVFGGSAVSPQILAAEGQLMPSMVLRLPDHGAWLQGIIAANTQTQINVRESLLSVYDSANTASTWHIPKSIRSKKDNNKSISEFNMSIVLDTTPQYVSNFDLSDFTDGLMSRFIIVHGPDVISNRQKPKANTLFISDVINKVFNDLLKVSVAHARPTNVNDMSNEALGVPKRIVIEYETGLPAYIDNIEDEIIGVIQDVQTKRLPQHYIAVSRCVLNTKRIASCIAILENAEQPVITRAIFDWSLRFVLASVTSIIRMFDTGAIGSDEAKQEAAIIDIIEREINKHPNEPYTTLAQLGKIADKLACFTKAKMGPRYTRQRVIADLIERGILQKTTVQTRGRSRQVITFDTNN